MFYYATIDPARCEDHSGEWFRTCALEGGPGSAICQSLYSNHFGLSDDPRTDKIAWLRKSADQGLANSMVKLARAHLKQLGSSLPGQKRRK